MCFVAMAMIFVLVACGDGSKEYVSYSNDDNNYANDSDMNDNGYDEANAPNGSVDEPPYESQNPDDENDDNDDDHNNGNDDANDTPPQDNPTDNVPPPTHNPPQNTNSGGNNQSGNNNPITPDPPPAVVPTGVTLNQTTATLDIGGRIILTATVVPNNAADRSVTWSSDNPSVATVNNGAVTAVSTGTTTITATTHNGRTATAVITVRQPAPAVVNATGISLNQTAPISLQVGNTATLIATVSPTNVTNGAVSWSSDRTTVATVTNGVITAVSVGTATITATSHNGIRATVQVTVTAPPVNPAVMEAEILRLVNIERANHGLPALTLHTGLANAARAHSMDMYTRNFVSHTCPSGRTIGMRISAAGLSGALENIFASGGNRTAEYVVGRWMASTGHRNAILSEHSTYAGVGFHNNHWTIKFGFVR